MQHESGETSQLVTLTVGVESVVCPDYVLFSEMVSLCKMTLAKKMVNEICFCVYVSFCALLVSELS